MGRVGDGDNHPAVNLQAGASSLAWTGLTAIVALPFYAIVYGGMGALGGVLSMQMFFKDRLAA